MPLAHMFWRLFGRLAALLALTVAGPSAMAAEPALVLSGRVVDDASLLDGSARAALTDKLAALEARTGIQFVVATTPSLGGQSIERYSLDLANAWGVGHKDRNDGLVLLVAPNEHGVRIEVGKGLETKLKDEMCDHIIQTAMIPRFSAGEMQAGIVAGTDAIIAEIDGTVTAQQDMKAAA